MPLHAALRQVHRTKCATVLTQRRNEARLPKIDQLLLFGKTPDEVTLISFPVPKPAPLEKWDVSVVKNAAWSDNDQTKQHIHILLIGPATVPFVLYYHPKRGASPCTCRLPSFEDQVATGLHQDELSESH